MTLRQLEFSLRRAERARDEARDAVHGAPDDVAALATYRDALTAVARARAQLAERAFAGKPQVAGHRDARLVYGGWRN